MPLWTLFLALAAWAVAPQAAAPPTIFDLVRRGTPEQVRAMIGKDASLVHTKDAAGNTPLHQAAIIGSVPMAETLLALGGAIDAANSATGTPLFEAINAGKTDVARLLIARGADVRKTGALGRGPLHWAARADQDTLVAPLVAKGADIELRDQQGVTPLMEAVMRAHTTAVVRALLESGADVNAKNRDVTVFEYALGGYYAAAAIVELLIDRGVSYTPVQTRPMLRVAAAGGSVALFRKLVDKHGDSLFADARANSTTMRNACLGGSVEIVQALLGRGIAIDNRPDANGLTLLHKIAEIPRAASLIELLVKNGLDIDARTLDGRTAFNLAVGARNEDARRRLAALGASQGPQQFPMVAGPYLGQTPPTRDQAPFARGIVNNNHGVVTMSPDGTEMYWSSPPSPGAPMTSRRVMVTSLREGRWTAPAVAPFSGTAADSPWFDDSPFVSPDNKKLFFLSTRPREPGGPMLMNLWVVERTAAGRSSPTPLSPELNAVWQFSVSKAGTLYFASATGDVYYSTFEKGKYSTPVNIGPAINSREMEACPFVAPDESYLIFSRMSGPELGYHISHRLKGGAWSQPIALKHLRGGPNAFVSPDGKYVFFGFENGFWAPATFIEESRPKER